MAAEGRLDDGGHGRGGAYDVQQQLGQGCYGAVFKAVREDGVECAVKRMLRHEDGSIPLAAHREAEIAGCLEHASVTSVLDISEDDEAAYLVMPLADESLLARFQRRPAPSGAHVRRWMRQLLSGLDYLATQRPEAVVHRDVKPENLLLTDGQLSLCDFGLATWLPARQARVGAAHARPLTPRMVSLCYRAPELLMGTQQYGTAVDVWAAGCVFAELLAAAHGRWRGPLFAGRGELHQLRLQAAVFGCAAMPWPHDSDRSRPRRVRQRHTLRQLLFGEDEAEEMKELDEDSRVALHLLAQLLQPQPDKRVTAGEALQHAYFSCKDDGGDGDDAGKGKGKGRAAVDKAAAVSSALVGKGKATLATSSPSAVIDLLELDDIVDDDEHAGFGDDDDDDDCEEEESKSQADRQSALESFDDHAPLMDGEACEDELRRPWKRRRQSAFSWDELL
eukprot:PLAT12464.1.p1 GENE.PLAT12464.1~~PLAT12464.1.p1  ORF type:complete len:449 (+),score=180.24 PLAT12464.1:196-1542(+)